jgi:signal peptidase II
MRHIALLGLILATLATDQLTKVWARSALKGHEARHYGPVALLYAENAGAFLSIGAQLPPKVRRLIFDGVVAIGLAAAAWVLFRGRIPADDVALALIIAGGVGNLIDRIRLGGLVTDFIYLSVGPLHTGVFNVADMAITAGVIWIAVAWLFARKPSRRTG